MTEIVPDLADHVARRLTAIATLRTRVVCAIDGPDASGKTTLADAVAGALSVGPGDAIRMSADDHQRARRDRHADGALSPRGYLEDAFDVTAIAAGVLAFRDGAARVQVASFDLAADRPSERWVDVPPHCVLVVDGVFLHRVELRACWDLVAYLRVSEEITLRRALCRDVPTLGTADGVLDRYEKRYLPAQRSYRRRDDPEGRADILVDNEDPALPILLREGHASSRPGPGGSGSRSVPPPGPVSTT